MLVDSRNLTLFALNTVVREFAEVAVKFILAAYKPIEANNKNKIKIFFIPYIFPKGRKKFFEDMKKAELFVPLLLIIRILLEDHLQP